MAPRRIAVLSRRSRVATSLGRHLLAHTKYTMRLHSPLVLTVLLTTHLTAANITPQPPPPQPQQQTIPVGNKKPSLFSQLTFRNLNPTLNLGAKRPLEDADLPSLPWGTAEAAAAFERQYDALGAVGAADKPNAAGLALYRAFGNEFVVSGLVKLLSDTCQLAACTHAAQEAPQAARQQAP